MMVGAGLAEVGKAARRPQPPHLAIALRSLAHLVLGREALQHGQIDRFGRGAQRYMRRAAFERADQRVDAAEIGIALAPIEEIERREMMLLDRLDLLGAEL